MNALDLHRRLTRIGMIETIIESAIILVGLIISYPFNTTLNWITMSLAFVAAYLFKSQFQLWANESVADQVRCKDCNHRLQSHLTLFNQPRICRRCNCPAFQE